MLDYHNNTFSDMQVALKFVYLAIGAAVASYCREYFHLFVIHSLGVLIRMPVVHRHECFF